MWSCGIAPVRENEKLRVLPSGEVIVAPLDSSEGLTALALAQIGISPQRVTIWWEGWR
jgi:hypothetical protein